MEFLKLYDEKNRDILYSMSWLNKNSIFDKSIGSFQEIDLFTFLENINDFDYDKDIFYDDVYYILQYTKDSILHLINNINKEIKREHKIVPISQAKEFDKKTILWLSRQDGRTVKEKLKNNKIKAVKRYSNVDTYENRVFKIFLKKLILIDETRREIDNIDYLIGKIRQWLRSDDAKVINEYGNIVYNNILLHHPHYSKIFKSYKWLNRLDEKVQNYIKQYPKQILDILTFDILTNIQFKTKKLILPSNLKVSYEEFEVVFNEDWLPEKLQLKKNIKNLKIKTIEEVHFNNIANLRKSIFDNQLKLKFDSSRKFYINSTYNKEVYLDLFRLFPIAKTDDRIINFPIMLKQKIDNKIVNANNTKIINLNYNFFTLPEILKNYDTDILRYFLEDLKKYFKNVNLYYIIPDYVNIFEFSKVKKAINSYFPKSRNISKSILAGLTYIFENNVKENDTLLYIQKSYDNNLYVTPLLVRYDNNLNSITHGLYLEKHPTKKLKDESDLLDELNQYFSSNISQKILSKFLQNGIKRIKKEQIAFYIDDEIIYLKNSKKMTNKKELRRNETIKRLFPSKKLFNKKTIEINDNNETNLKNYQKLIELEKEGFILWKEHLPRLAMGDMPLDGYFGEFVLVDDNSEIINGEIEIKNHFIIPANIKELSFPLILGDENLNYEAYITSNELPLKEPVECELKLTYDYEAETPYELTFIALNNEIKTLKVKWREIQYKKCEDLPIPVYPQKKSWEDFKRDPKRSGDGYSNLLEWIIERLELLKNIEDIPKFILEKEINRIKQNNKLVGYYKWGKNDKNGRFFCFVEVDGEDIFCHSSNFKENIEIDELYKGKEVFLNIKNNSEKLNGYNITFTKISEEQKIKKIKDDYRKKPIYQKVKPLIKSLQSIRYPLLTVWNNHSLQDFDVPNDFRIIITKYIQNSIDILKKDDMPKDLKEELLFFLSSLHQDTPQEVSNLLLNYSQNLQKYKKYDMQIALSLGNCQLEWQQSILKNIMSQMNNTSLHNDILNILAVASWRSDIFIFKLLKFDINKVIKILYNTLLCNFNLYKKPLGNIVKQLEFLFALLRIRQNSNYFCLEDIQTKYYINLVDKITKYIVDNKIKIKTRLQFYLKKPSNFTNTPDLLYALRVYLSGDTNIANNIQVLGVSDD